MQECDWDNVVQVASSPKRHATDAMQHAALRLPHACSMHRWTTVVFQQLATRLAVRCREPRPTDSQSPKNQESKDPQIPKIQKPKDPKLQKSKNPTTQKPQNPKNQRSKNPKNPKIPKPKNPKTQRSKNPKTQTFGIGGSAGAWAGKTYSKPLVFWVFGFWVFGLYVALFSFGFLGFWVIGKCVVLKHFQTSKNPNIQ